MIISNCDGHFIAVGTLCMTADRLIFYSVGEIFHNLKIFLTYSESRYDQTKTHILSCCHSIHHPANAIFSFVMYGIRLPFASNIVRIFLPSNFLPIYDIIDNNKTMHWTIKIYPILQHCFPERRL